MKALRTALCILLLSAASANARDGDAVLRDLQSDDDHCQIYPMNSGMNGNDVLRALQSNAPTDRTYILGYVNGIWQGIEAGVQAVLNMGENTECYHSEVHGVCISEGVGSTQLADVFFKYLKDHPEFRHYDIFSLLPDALHEAFPCPPE